MALSLLTACGSKDNGNTPSGSTGGNSTPGTSQGGGDTAKSGELFDITDDKINTYKLNNDGTQTAITGDERTTMLAAIPAEMKKGIGTLNTNSVQKDLYGDGYLIGFTFRISSKDDYTKLTDYYKSLGGTVKKEGSTDTEAYLEIDFDWGKLTQCLYGESGSSKTIAVSFETN
jgi:major membrane immunogen (membrane-anchored lipoprotein)